MDRLDRIAVGKHIGDVMDQHTRSVKDRLTAQNFGVPRDHRLCLS